MANIIPSTPYAAATNQAIKQIVKGEGDKLYAWNGVSAQHIPDPNQLSGLIAQGYKDTRAPLASVQLSGSVSNDPRFLAPGPRTNAVPEAPQAAQDPITIFNNSIYNMLKEAQGTVGNESLYGQQTALQRAAIGRQSEITPEALRDLSPQQQEAIRSGNMKALEPEIDAVGSKIKARDAKLRNFESMLGTLRQMGGDMIKANPTPEILGGYVNMLRRGGNLTSVPAEVRDKVVALMSDDDWKQNATSTSEYKPQVVFDPSTGIPYEYDFNTKSVRPLNFSGVTTPTPTPSQGGSGSVSYRTNNPGNIKWTGASWQTALGAEDSGIQAKDGGSFAKFPNYEAGVAAQMQLLQAPSYANLTVDEAMKRWSNNGYGGEIAQAIGISPSKKMNQLTSSELGKLQQVMQNREGYFAGQGTSQQPSADINKINNALKNFISQETKPSQQAYQRNLNDLLNQGDVTGAKNFVLQAAIETEPVASQTGIKGRADAVLNLDRLKDLINEYVKISGDTNIIKGSIEDFNRKLGTTTDPRLAEIKNISNTILFDYRRAMTGVQFSLPESEQYKEMFPNYNNVNSLNIGLIDSLANKFMFDQQNYFKRKVGSGNYNSVVGGASTDLYGLSRGGINNSGSTSGNSTSSGSTSSGLKYTIIP
jgi:hypothetical protein